APTLGANRTTAAVLPTRARSRSRPMAEISLAYASSHAPMMAAARDSAPEEQRNTFFGALDAIRDEARRRDIPAVVVLSNEHFTNCCLENLPQFCLGVGERNWGQAAAWLPIDKLRCPGQPGIDSHTRPNNVHD